MDSKCLYSFLNVLFSTMRGRYRIVILLVNSDEKNAKSVRNQICAYLECVQNRACRSHKPHPLTNTAPTEIALQCSIIRISHSPTNTSRYIHILHIYQPTSTIFYILPHYFVTCKMSMVYGKK